MYRLTGRLEQSQLADLFRGERVEANEPVVLKLFHLKTSDAAYAKVVADIARQLQSVTHGGVARVLDVGMIDGHLAIVRQDTGKYTLGLALQRLNTREVMLPPAVALALAVELLEAVGAAHEAGVVHSALTPGNILLGVDGSVCVADFGALTALQAAPVLKKSFGARGRDSYRAPEQGGGDPATIAGDLYALGAITYELLTLHEASTGNANVSTRSDRLPPPSRLVRRLHSRIDPIIMRALENAPNRRHRSCAEFAEGIREFLSASGGMPGRDDLKKFVGELFPNEVQLSAEGPVPIERAFDLTDIAGIGGVEADPIEVEERPSFSRGRVDDRTPTSDGLPVFTGELPQVAEPQPLSRELEVKTQPDVMAVAKRAVSEWDAPPGVMAVTAGQAGPTPQQPVVDPLKGRVRVQEDFAELPGAEKPAPKPAPREKVAKTLMTFAVPGRVHVDRSIGLEAQRKKGQRTVRVLSLFGALALMGTVTGTAYAWFKSQNDPKGALLSYLPDAIEREVAPDNKPLPPVGKPLKLADFDKLHPEKAFDPDPDPKTGVTPTPKKVTPPVVEKPAPPPIVKTSPDCYDTTPKGKVGYLTIGAMTSVRVEIDGKRVCVNATKVPVAAGSHKLKVTDVKSKQEDVSNIRIEAGKLVKITPVFRSR
ncbi:MAG: protein kinase [Archangium sp.]|nr:protein kinase [Archangium sp.]